MQSSNAAGKGARKRKLAPDDDVALTADEIGALLERHTRRLDERMQLQSDRFVELKAKNAALEEECRSLQLQVDELSKDNARVREDYRARCDSLERSIQVLMKDVNWKYSAPDIPRSHWIEQGYDEGDAAIMEAIIRQMKDDVKRVRNGTHSEHNLLFEGILSIQHDDALLPHFQELADAVQVSGGGIDSIDIYGFELRPSSLKILMPVMENKVSNVNMYRLRFPAMRCYEIICRSIRRNHRLKKLQWIGIEIESDEQAELLIESIIDNQSIKSVSLDSSFVGRADANGCRALTSLMTSGRSFETLDFGNNGLSVIHDVAAALATNPCLEILNMSGNELDDRDAELIAHALKQNTTLRKLRLDRNDFTSAGFGRIRTAIYEPSSLNAMESCNHICYIDCVAGNDYLMTPQQRRNRKLYKLLSTRHAEGSNSWGRSLAPSSLFQEYSSASD